MCAESSKPDEQKSGSTEMHDDGLYVWVSVDGTVKLRRVDYINTETRSGLTEIVPELLPRERIFRTVDGKIIILVVRDPRE